MQLPSLSLILCEIFLVYMAYSIYTIFLLFVIPTCEDGKVCLISYLNNKPSLQLHIFSSTVRNPMEREVSLVHRIQEFNYSLAQDIPVSMDIPLKTQQNGTLFLHLLLVPESGKYVKSFNTLKRDPYLSYSVINMTQYAIPEAETFNLLRNKEKTGKLKTDIIRPVSHIKSHVTFTIMTDDIKLPIDNVPMELIRDIRIVHGHVFLPIINFDFLQTRQRDLVRITSKDNAMDVKISYSPISLGKLRMILQVEAAMQNMKNFGFSDKDIDEIKGIFADMNIYLLAVTAFIAAIHLVFDFLAFKNDINFWKSKTNLAGLSTWTVTWRAFSQTVIFLYLFDESTSLLVLVPTGIASIIEIWKLKKIFKVQFVRVNSILPRIKIQNTQRNEAEIKTREFDSESMRYLSYLLYPLVIGGAIYSLLYQPHKSWYSWSINSLVNGVYAFGFLFMLPQLFVNYKLKSVAHLPWRAFMYKAFNTFIDDVFAFIITMPAAHRIACFRDDAVFLIYLYQRWLYPVDKSRIDVSTVTEETVNFSVENKKTK